MKAMGGKTGFHADHVGIGYMVAGDAVAGSNTDPFDTHQDPGEVWVREGPHVMIVFPDSQMLNDFSKDPNSGGPYVMWQSTPYAHLMVPVAPRIGHK